MIKLIVFKLIKFASGFLGLKSLQSIITFILLAISISANVYLIIRSVYKHEKHDKMKYEINMLKRKLERCSSKYNELVKDYERLRTMYESEIQKCSKDINEIEESYKKRLIICEGLLKRKSMKKHIKHNHESRKTEEHSLDSNDPLLDALNSMFK